MTAASPARRLVAVHWPLAVVCALFLLMGAITLDDYGISADESGQRAIGNAALDFLAGDGERAFGQLRHASNRYYGAAFEAPLALIGRAFGPDDARAVHLARRALTHLFFLAGGVACYLLAHRLFGSRALALAAMVLFLLHPRIYAHSFFNSKDAPFLAAFMIALYLVHRAFRRETLGAFLLCGAVVGLLVNLRVMGIALFAAVLALRALDLLAAGGADERKRALLTAGAFALAAMLTYHASLPALWSDPFGEFAAQFAALRDQPPRTINLFLGERWYSANGPPLAYVPVWIAITTPPATLLLAALGAMALARRGLRRPRDLLRDGPTRFGLLLVALPVATTVMAVVLESNLYNGWRHLYFLYAPLLLLAAFGLREIVRFGRGRFLKAGAYALAGAAVAVAIVSMARIHPLQHSYFSLLVDRATPERLASRYGMDYWGLSARSVLGDILAAHPSGPIRIATDAGRNIGLQARSDRERITVAGDFRSGEANFHDLFSRARFPSCPVSLHGTHVARVYGATIRCVVDPVAYFGGLRREALATAPLDRSRFAAHRVGNMMVYVRDGCSADDMGTRFFLHVHPAATADLPARLWEFPDHYGQYGFEKRDFDFERYGARIDGDCVAAVPLPTYPIARIETGQYTPAWAEAARRAVAEAEPLTSAHFDVYADGRALTYVRDDCAAEDADTRFFLHVHPADPADLPEHRARHGFDNLNFSLRQQGARTDDGACVAAAPLPRYPIASVRTGQFSADGRLWEAEFAPPQ